MMRSQVAAGMALGLFGTVAAWGQSVPIYQVTVIERTVKAVNYQYRGGQTQIDFAGTVLLPQAKGEALVESKAGRTEIDVKFSRVAAPTRFGREYLTYVLWAITPEGHAKNLGEVLADASDRAHLLVTTDLQAFGMIVTAEPYSAVRQPSDVVVMENIVRPDTIGKSEPIQARYDLLPRGTYTYDKSAATTVIEGPKVSMDRYESLLAVYQAQNAVQIARSQGADKYAADTLAKAESLLAEARQMEEHRLGRSAVVTEARQAAQTAEDARVIAVKRAHDTELATARAEAAEERTRREEAERRAQNAQAELDRARSDAAAAAVVNIPQQTEHVVVVPAPQPPTATQPPAAPQPDRRKLEARMHLQHQMNSYFPTMDTPRGLVITLHDRDFRGAALDPAIAARVANLASAISGQRGLSVEVEGHGEQNSSVRAAEVRDTLVHGGLHMSEVISRGLGASRPLVSRETPHAAEQNRRVEIIISGEPIGTLASWDRAYPLR
jgi:outer membrane protein OmpA-like peptidoglycan-associated protein